jgi:hypothetical protein
MRGLTAVASLLVASLLAAPLLADEAASLMAAAATGPQVGDCVIFREGGAGQLLTTPTYWLKGSLAAVSRRQHQFDRCPRLGKPLAAYTPADRARLAAAMPCAEHASSDLPRAVEVIRVQVTVAEWETPWSYQHGTTGWLFRGQFLEQALQKGAVIDMDAAWLERCEPER